MASRAGPALLNVVLFSGGRGSGVLSRLLVSNPAIRLTVTINGYDDGASTGEVRRFLGDSLGPSDFRKNASHLARTLQTCDTALVDLLDQRLPHAANVSSAMGLSDAVRTGATGSEVLADVAETAARLTLGIRDRVASRLQRFENEFAVRGEFSFSDCSIGNLVFAGAYLLHERAFNPTVDDYCELVGLPEGLVENVTDGTNAFLVAIDVDNRVLAHEAEIVDAKQRNRIRDIYLIDRPLSDEDLIMLQRAAPEAAGAMLERRAAPLAMNTRLAERIAEADLIVYAPGTQHSSLFPSYLTPGLSAAIASNVRAIKLFITNIQADAEIAGSSAVDIIERAVYYLKEKGRVPLPAPAFLTHYLINDPGHAQQGLRYVPLGRLESLEDPRLVRIGNYEEGVTGRHDAEKVLGPFVEALLARGHDRQRVAVLLHGASSADKISQTLLEMVRGHLQDRPVDVTVFYESASSLPPEFLKLLPFDARRVAPLAGSVEADREFRQLLSRERFEYVILFESSGMYNGEDVAGLAAHLTLGRLDAVWGSRRLSVRDIHESYRLKYRHNIWLGAVSYAGSHALSLLYLLLYGRYVSDTLSAARAVRVSIACGLGVGLTDKQANQHLLAALLGRRAEMYEIPVQFFPISPERVRRTTVGDGLVSVLGIVWRRLVPPTRSTEREGDTTAAAGMSSEPSAVEAASRTGWRPME